MLYRNLINEASRVVMRPNDHELKGTVFHYGEVTLADGEAPAVMYSCPPTIIFVVKWVNIMYALLNVCVAVADLQAIMKQYISEMAVLQCYT